MNKSVVTRELFDCSVKYLKDLFSGCQYPWEIISSIKDYIAALTPRDLEGFREICPGVWIGEKVRVYSAATIEAPAVIGHGSVVLPGAFVRGNVITGRGCVLGNSSEFKNCILLNEAKAPHYNYVGDSIMGNRAHIGGATICSNLKTDGKNVVVHGDKTYNTGLRKFGAILGDGADAGCSCVLNPGTIVGKNTRIYPNLSLRGVYPSECIVKDKDNIVKIEY